MFNKEDRQTFLTNPVAAAARRDSAHSGFAQPSARAGVFAAAFRRVAMWPGQSACVNFHILR